MTVLTDDITWKRYPAYKESGEAWIGKVPVHWEVGRLGARFRERREKVSDADFEALSVTKNGIFPQLESAAKTNDGDNRKLVRAGDFVINSRSDRKGSSGVSELDGSVSLINIVLNPDSIDRAFCNYLLKSNAFVEEYYRIGRGIVADLWTTRYSEMKNVKIALPSSREQTAIANFLDDKTAKIDEAIRQKERMIELLKERKQIIIQNAVTKGLDPNVPMKDSGIEWIGEIPAHWEIQPMKHSLTGIIDCEHKTAPFVSDPEYFVVRTSNVKNGKLLIKNAKFTTQLGYKIWTNRGVPCPGDVLLTREAPAGEACLVPSDRLICLGQRMVWLKIDRSKLVPEFAISLIYSNLVRTYIDFLSAGSTVLHFNMADIKNIPIMVCPVAEQQQIVSFINERNNEIDRVIQSETYFIATLKEYRATLIDSAVTGKIDVSDYGK